MSAAIENEYLKSINYVPVQEAEFTINHPMVLQWTETFHKEFLSHQIFQKFGAIPSSQYLKSELVGSAWHHFSTLVPEFLCYAAAKVSNNRLRHYVIQIAFEELGMRDVNEIHSDMFQQAFLSTQIGIPLKAGEFNPKALDMLKEVMQNFQSDGYILGILLGFEIPAEENISTVFNALAYDLTKLEYLEKTKFFQLHRQIESEHIRLNVSNFLRFCASDEERNLFRAGVTKGIEFWSLYWNELGRELLERNSFCDAQ